MPTTPQQDEVSILINGKLFRGWTSVEILLSLDRFSTASFTAPFDPDRPEMRKTFRPFLFYPMEVRLGGQPLFTGTVLDIDPASDANGSAVTCSGFALPGNIAQCTMPAASLPLEFKGLNFQDILDEILRPFNLGYEVRADIGGPFKMVELDPTKKVLDFLIDLAKQRGLLLSSTFAGKVLCWKATAPGNPVEKLGRQPAGKVTAQFQSSDYFSEITGLVPTKRKREGSKFTEANPWLTDVLRPMNFKLEDSEPGEGPAGAQRKMGRMFANMASYEVADLPTWRTRKGLLWQPNLTLTLSAPEAMVYNETELLIRSVSLKQDANGKTSSLNLVLPESFHGRAPKSLPWAERGLSDAELGLGVVEIEEITIVGDPSNVTEIEEITIVGDPTNTVVRNNPNPATSGAQISESAGFTGVTPDGAPFSTVAPEEDDGGMSSL